MSSSECTDCADCMNMTSLNFDDDCCVVFVDNKQQYSAVCNKCCRHIKDILSSDEVQAYENRNVTCGLCQKFIKHYDACEIFHCGKTYKRCQFKTKLLDIHSTDNWGTLRYICESCFNHFEHTEVSEHIYCDFCHKQYDRFDNSDIGMGFCGEVMRNVKYDSPGFFCCSLPTTLEELMNPHHYEYLDGYIINCEYGSKYDACDDYREFIKFNNTYLFDDIKIGMNICDDCIDYLIKEGVCSLQNK
jgi:hypothetical protein